MIDVNSIILAPNYQSLSDSSINNVTSCTVHVYYGPMLTPIPNV